MKAHNGIVSLSLRQKKCKASIYQVCLWIWMVMLLCVGCSTSENRINLNNENAGQSIVLSVGEIIELTLQTIGPGQYGDPIVSSGSVKFLGESSPDASSPGGLRQNPGGPTQLYRFEVVKSGQADITIPHTESRPDGSAIPAFTITISVK
jgi:hypothetical protein